MNEGMQRSADMPKELERILLSFTPQIQEQVRAFEDRDTRAELNETITTTYPTHIALLTQRFLENSFKRRIKRPLETCNVMLDLFLLSTQFFSFMGLVSYSRNPHLHSDRASSLIRKLRDEQKHFYGDWWGLFREITRCFIRERDKCIMPELIDFYWKKGGKTQKYIDILDKVPNIRNKVFGHKIGLSEDVAKEVILGFRNYVAFLLSQWRFLESYFIFAPTDDYDLEDGKYVHEIYCFRGCQPQNLEVYSLEALKESHLYIIRPQSSHWLAEDDHVLQPGEAIQISPLLIYDESIAESEPIKLYLQFQSATKAKKRSEPETELQSAVYQISNGTRELETTAEFSGELDEETRVLRDELYHVFENALAGGFDALTYKEERKEAPQIETESLSWEDIIRVCRLNSDHHLSDIRGKKKYIRELYINRHEVEHAFDSFCTSDKTGFVLIGSSGMGKTNLLCHLYDQYEQSGHAMLFISSAQIDRSLNIEDLILKELNIQTTFRELCERINTLCAQKNKLFIILIDAVNEFMYENTGPPDLVKKTDELIAKNSQPRIKFVITSRTKTWKTIQSSYNVTLSKSFYYSRNGTQKMDIAHTISRYSENELQKAYNKYASYHDVKSQYIDISKVIHYELADPLMLRFVCEIYTGQQIPLDIHNQNIFEKYFNHFIYDEENDEGDATLQMLVYNIANCMLQLKKDNIYVHNDLEKSMLFKSVNNFENLLQQLKDTKIGSTYINLVDKGILNEIHINKDRMIKFTYDRFLEHVLSNVITAHIGQIYDTDKLWHTRRNAIVQTLVGYIEEAKNFNTLWGSLIKSMLSIQEGKVKKISSNGVKPISTAQFVDIMKAMSDHDLNVLNLLGEALENILYKDRETFELICKNIRKKEEESSLEILIECTFSILSSEKFRLHYLDSSKNEQRRIRNILYNNLAYGLKQPPGRIADKTIQYIYFLWWIGYPEETKWQFYKYHSESILDTLVDDVSVGKMVSSEARNTLMNLFGLILLLIAEKSEEPAQIHNILYDIKKLIHNLHIKLLKNLLVFITQSILSIVPNPINLGELKELFAETQKKNTMRNILLLLDPTTTPLHEVSKSELLEMASQSNSFLYSLLSFAISTQYSIHSRDHPDTYLELLDHLFQNGNAIAVYVVSYALYQMNYFGPNQTKQSLLLMDRVARSILSEHKGTFQTGSGSGEYNFHIIGTYGRAIEKNPSLEGAIHSGDNEYFAVQALESAKQQGDPEFYIYVCTNIGLLGTLIRPRKALEIIKYIMEDIGVLDLPDDGRVEYAFDDQVTEAIYTEIKQSLSKIRVRFQREVDHFLIDIMDNRALYEEVRKLVPDYTIGEFYSWLFDELFYKMFVYYPDLAHSCIQIFIHALQQQSAEKAITHVVSSTIDMIAEWAKKESSFEESLNPSS